MTDDSIRKPTGMSDAAWCIYKFFRPKAEPFKVAGSTRLERNGSFYRSLLNRRTRFGVGGCHGTAQGDAVLPRAGTTSPESGVVATPQLGPLRIVPVYLAEVSLKANTVHNLDLP